MAHFCLGLALQRLGQLPRAVQALQVAVALNPNFLEAHQRLARLYERRLNDPEKAAEHRRVLAEIRATRQGHTPSPTPDASLTAGVPAATVPAAVSSALAAPINVRPAAGATARVGVSLLGSDNHTQSITVVTGLPRSGTSMIMKMLADGGMSVLADGVRTADADNPLGYFEYEAAKRLRTDGSWLGAAVGKAVKIVAQLVPYLPDHYAYRVIFIERDLREVLASQQVMLQRQGRQGARLTSAQLQATFETQLHQVKHGLTARAHVETLFVCHADILADPAAGAAMLNQFVGGYLDTVAMSQAVDTTLHRQRVMQA
jgi:hypothetical protein